MKKEKISGHKTRLDVEMTERALARSRSASQDLIRRGKVIVNGKVAVRPSDLVGDGDTIAVTEAQRFVSRAGEKLDHALDLWKVDVSGMTVVDIGSSTGGFTDCLLQRGVRKVVAIEVGTDQMDASLRGDPRIELHEQTDVRKFSLPSPADLVVADVSFISLAHVLPKVFEFLKPGGETILLVKPQFEVGMEIAKKRKGVISDDTEREAALESVESKAREIGLDVVSHTGSPIEGESGNREYLLLARKPL